MIDKLKFALALIGLSIVVALVIIGTIWFMWLCYYAGIPM